ncbi:hypothetical protein EJC47_11030 [Sphingomonas sp. TF3]|uniref:hypothetical protein n=1 Tax=Sphingomonas sp. TF3 TaxID=2495580 RepID=UPI000F865402|nr:hypothetical protein [Sphingomonas sp. TF3]RUN76497.1 hypothetical protein EJC47_11030 [Sphingomonas sp. TF3]
MRSRDVADLGHLAGHGGGLQADTSDNATWRLVDQPGFLRHLSEMVASNPPVSSQSRFLDPDWRLDVRPPAGRRFQRVGFEGIDPDLANELRIALLVAMAHPSSKRLSVSSAGPLGRSLVMLGGWMTHAGARSISHLGEGFGELFMQALFEFVDLIQSGTFDSDAGDWDPRQQLEQRPQSWGRKGPSASLVEESAEGPIHLWDMRVQIRGLVDAGVHGAPFHEETAHKVARSWGEMGDAATRRLPPAVQLILEAGARRLMGTPATDVARLVRDFADRYRECADRDDAATAALDGFVFSTIAGEAGPWWTASHDYDRHSPFQRIVRLIHLIRDAAAVLVLLAVGMRPQEFLGLMGGSKARRLLRTDGGDAVGDRRQSVPRSVTEMLSKSGYTVLLVLNGHVFKRERRPRPVSWLMGGRQDGGADPVALEALCVIEALHEPLREFAVDGSGGMLIVDFVDARDPGYLTMSHCSSARFSHSLQRSIPLFAGFSGLPNRDAGFDYRRYKADGYSLIAIYQFRKTWAQANYKLEPALLPAISRQLQHKRPEDTKRTYVTNDPDYLRELDRAVSAHTGLLVREVFDGDLGVEGTMSDAIDEVLAMIGPVMSDASQSELWRTRVARVEAGPPLDRLRPLAGMANLATEIDDGPGASPFADAAPRDGPAVMRTFVAERRRWLSDLDAGQTDLGRPSRDRALIAARRLNECGFPIGGLAEGLAGVDGLEELRDAG